MLRAEGQCRDPGCPTPLSLSYLGLGYHPLQNGSPERDVRASPGVVTRARDESLPGPEKGPDGRA